MGDSVRFVIPGNPRGKAAIQGGFTAHRFPDKKSQAEIDAIRMIARIAMNGRPPFEGPVYLKLAAYMAVPKSWSQKDRALALAGKILPTVKPDADNIQKLTDGIQPPPPPKRKKNESEHAFMVRRKTWEMIKVVVIDDKQIVRWQGWKKYDASPRLVVEISEIDIDS